MKELGNRERQEKRAQAQGIQTTLQVGKNGVTAETVAELKAQLHRHKLVKVRFLPASTQEEDGKAQAALLAAQASAHLIEVRGHTAVFWRG
ncbi:MAG: YhbY family RNA-binding protein [Thermoplasmatota archaeon]